MTVTKRKMAGLILMCTLLTVTTACATNQPTQSTAPQTAASKPAAVETKSTEWDEIVKLANKEGEVTVVSHASAEREELMKRFEQTYPGIKVKYMGQRMSDASPKILEEQKQGRFLSDVFLEGAQPAAAALTPNGALEDLHKYILLPEVKDDKNWVKGFEEGFKMTDGKDQYAFAALPVPAVNVNNDVIPAGEIKTLEDLVNPKWKGKIAIFDFSVEGTGTLHMAPLYMLQGEEYMRKLIEQKPVLVNNVRQLAEYLATGKYPITIGATTYQLRLFQQQGLLKNMSTIQPPKTTIVQPITVAVLKNPPHPNATKVFVNWLLSKEGQTQYASLILDYQGRRTDAPVAKDVRSWNEIDYKYSTIGPEFSKAWDWVANLGKQIKGSQ